MYLNNRKGRDNNIKSTINFWKLVYLIHKYFHLFKRTFTEDSKLHLINTKIPK